MAKGKKTGGRQKGTPNKATAQACEAIAEFITGNIDRLNGWLDTIEKEDGAQAAQKFFMSVLEYYLPKQQRIESKQEITDDRGQEIQEEDLQILKNMGIVKNE